MAKKTEITADIRSMFGNVLSENQARKYLGMGVEQTKQFLSDVPFFQEERKKRYLAIDLARKIYERQQTVC